MEEYLRKMLNYKSVKNGIWLYTLQFFNLVLPLLTIPYITRIFGVETYGKFAIALNMITYLQIIVEYGFGMSVTRKIAIKGRDGLAKMFTIVLYARLTLLAGSLCLAILYIAANRENQMLCISFMILLICLLGNCVQMNYVFQGLQEMKYISIVNVLGRTISTGLIFALVRDSNDIFLYSVLYSLSPVLSGFIGLVIARNRYKLKLVKVSLCDVIAELKNGFYVFTTQLSSKVFGAIGITFLGIYGTGSTVGGYSAVQKIPAVLILLWAPIAQIIYPMVSAKFNLGFSVGYSFVRKIRKITMPFFIMVAIGIGIFARFIVYMLFGAEYELYYIWLYPLLAWLLVAIDNNFWGIQLLLGSGHDEEYGKAFNLSVGITVIINFVLIYFLSGLGASIAPLLSEFFLNFLLRKAAMPIIKHEK